MPVDHSAEYRSRTDGDLLQLWVERSDLLPEAEAALQSEIARRGLAGEAATAKDMRCEDGDRRFNRLVPRSLGSKMQTLGILPLIASVIAFVIAGSYILSGALLGPIVILPFALVPFCAGIGILRSRAWSAYGFATLIFARQLLVLAVILLRPWGATGRVPEIVVYQLASIGLGILFLLAGHALAASSATRGKAWPWILATALFTAPAFFVWNFEIPSTRPSSMENTILPGDGILAQMFPLSLPKRGQIVIVISPAERGVTLIKRVIAVPGDHLRIERRVVILNGTALDEKYVTHEAHEDFLEDFPSAVELPGCAEGHEMLSQQIVDGEIVVPAGNYFVLGDNRDDSLDSRCWGFVRSGDVIGKPLMIYDSIAEQTLEPGRISLRHRRWTRLFKIL
jgi:signal peptidase I